jgi:hypothetical protein
MKSLTSQKAEGAARFVVVAQEAVETLQHKKTFLRTSSVQTLVQEPEVTSFAEALQEPIFGCFPSGYHFLLITPIHSIGGVLSVDRQSQHTIAFLPDFTRCYLPNYSRTSYLLFNAVSEHGEGFFDRRGPELPEQQRNGWSGREREETERNTPPDSGKGPMARQIRNSLVQTMQ